jgi:putative ABC transport system permease protein
VALANFKQTLALNINVMSGLYSALAVIIAFGVVFNVARITLSERSRELASLRVLGFGRGEVFRILVSELFVLTLVAQPLGWLIGYGIAWVMRANMAGELMRVPLVVSPATYASASGAVLVAAGLSSMILWRRIARLDLVAVLKTRD